MTTATAYQCLISALHTTAQTLPAGYSLSYVPTDDQSRLALGIINHNAAAGCKAIASISLAMSDTISIDAANISRQYRAIIPAINGLRAIIATIINNDMQQLAA